MNPQHQVTRTLHDEHLATIAAMERLESFIRGAGGSPPVADQLAASPLAATIAVLEGEVSGHFSFEESELFPLLAELGDGAIGEFLTEEHAVILPAAERLVLLARAAQTKGFDAEAWEEFRRLAAELVERMISHIQKEEMALLPALDDVLDDDSDGRLAMAYAAMR